MLSIIVAEWYISFRMCGLKKYDPKLLRNSSVGGCEQLLL